MAQQPLVFDPKTCRFGNYPNLPDKRTLRAGMSGPDVGYLQGVLKCKSGQSQLNIRPLPGPWDFGPMTETAVRNFQTFWGLTVDGVVGRQTWPLIDWAAKGFPT